MTIENNLQKALQLTAEGRPFFIKRKILKICRSNRLRLFWTADLSVYEPVKHSLVKFWTWFVHWSAENCVSKILTPEFLCLFSAIASQKRFKRFQVKHLIFGLFYRDFAPVLPLGEFTSITSAILTVRGRWGCSDLNSWDTKVDVFPFWKVPL